MLFQKLQQEPDLEAVLIDATIVRAHACSAGYGKESQPQQALGKRQSLYQLVQRVFHLKVEVFTADFSDFFIVEVPSSLFRICTSSSFALFAS